MIATKANDIIVSNKELWHWNRLSGHGDDFIVL